MAASIRGFGIWTSGTVNRNKLNGGCIWVNGLSMLAYMHS